MNFEENLLQWLTNGAILSTAAGQVLLGWGERKQFATPSDSNQKTTFYFPDFFLKDERPWFQYENTQEIEILHLLQILTKQKTPLTHHSTIFAWKNEYYDLFCATFKDLKQHMAASRLDKAVPFVFETSSSVMTTAQLNISLCNLLNYLKEHPVYLYGFWDQTEGMLGLTPEVLFRCTKNQQLETMACAGTCGKHMDLQEFLSDMKQASEHQWVVKGIQEALIPFGKVHIGDRQLLSLPNINHLVTPIRVDMDNSPKFENIARALHPTPALGAFPRPAGMRWLEAYQQHIPRGRFGAPVGYLKNDGTSACFVAIRNVQWNLNEMLVGAGCGIVAASDCDNEWAEINLKLKATKEMLGLL